MGASTILQIVALVCFIAAAVNVKSPIGLVPLGLAAWVLAGLV